MKYQIKDGMYRRKERNIKEPFFFVFLLLFLYLKFYFLRQTVSASANSEFLSEAATFAFILLFIIPASLAPARLRLFSVLTLDFLLSALVFTDLLHLRYYSDLFSIANLGLSAQVGEVAESVIALLHPYDAFYFIDIPILYAGALYFKKDIYTPLFCELSFSRCALSLAMVLLAFCTIFLRVHTYEKVMPKALASMWDKPAVCCNVGVLTYHAADAWNAVTHYWYKSNVSEDEINEAAVFFKNTKEYEPNDKESVFFGMAKGCNLIIIQVESLQNFVVDLHLDGVPVTPNLNKFVKDCMYFARTYSQTAAGNSADAEFIANAGMFPASSGVAYLRFAQNTYEALPKLLSDAGYGTLALHGDRPGFWNRQHMYPSLGFERFISKKDFKADEDIGMGLSDKSFFKQSIGLLSKEKKPFYAFLVTLTSHYPFNFPKIAEQTQFDAGKFKGQLLGDYLCSMRYFDTQFGMFINGLKSKGLLESSVIVVYGDHPAIPQWDKKNLEILLGHSLKENYAWRDTLKIPLLIRMPKAKTTFVEKNTPTSLMDIPNTVLPLLGFERQNFGFGRNILHKTKSRSYPIIFRNGSYILNDALIDGSSKTAVRMKDGSPLNYSDFKDTTEKVRETLIVNDITLEHDLIPKLQH